MKRVWWSKIEGGRDADEYFGRERRLGVVNLLDDHKNAMEVTLATSESL